MVDTARDVITSALKKSGVTGQGREPSASDVNDGLGDLNGMLDIWTIQRWLVWDLLNIGVTSTGAQVYTAGPAGDYNTATRPNRIASAFLRQLSQSAGAGGNFVDTPVDVIAAREEYDRISLKSLVSFTQYVFLETSWPLAKVHFYPVPQANIYSMYLSFKDVMPVLTLDSDMSVFPRGYRTGMVFNLARWLRQAYGKGLKPDPELNRIANMTLSIIKNANLQIPELVMPKVLVAGSPGYNILSDQF